MDLTPGYTLTRGIPWNHLLEQTSLSTVLRLTAAADGAPLGTGEWKTLGPRLSGVTDLRFCNLTIHPATQDAFRLPEGVPGPVLYEMTRLSCPVKRLHLENVQLQESTEVSFDAGRWLLCLMNLEELVLVGRAPGAHSPGTRPRRPPVHAAVVAGRASVRPGSRPLPHDAATDPDPRRHARVPWAVPPCVVAMSRTVCPPPLSARRHRLVHPGGLVRGCKDGAGGPQKNASATVCVLVAPNPFRSPDLTRAPLPWSRLPCTRLRLIVQRPYQERVIPCGEEDDATTEAVVRNCLFTPQ